MEWVSIHQGHTPVSSGMETFKIGRIPDPHVAREAPACGMGLGQRPSVWNGNLYIRVIRPCRLERNPSQSRNGTGNRPNGMQSKLERNRHISRSRSRVKGTVPRQTPTPNPNPKPKPNPDPGLVPDPYPDTPVPTPNPTPPTKPNPNPKPKPNPNPNPEVGCVPKHLPEPRHEGKGKTLLKQTPTPTQNPNFEP